MLAISQILCWTPAAVHLILRTNLWRDLYCPWFRWGKTHRDAGMLQAIHWVTVELGGKARAPDPQCELLAVICHVWYGKNYSTSLIFHFLRWEEEQEHLQHQDARRNKWANKKWWCSKKWSLSCFWSDKMLPIHHECSSGSSVKS